jgi:hypothetical protein
MNLLELKQRIRADRDLCADLGHPPYRKYYKRSKGRAPASWWCQCGQVEWVASGWR